MIYPCKDCKKRCVGCHSTCEEYIECREKYRAIAGTIQHDRENGRVINEVRDKKFRSLGYK